MRNELYDIFNELNNAFYENDYRGFPVDVKEVEGGYEITAELAGVKKEDIKIDYLDSILTITANKHINNHKDAKFLVKERHDQKLRRSLDFGNIEEDQIKAKFENGLLVITLLTKKPEGHITKNIVIE